MEHGRVSSEFLGNFSAFLEFFLLKTKRHTYLSLGITNDHQRTCLNKCNKTSVSKETKEEKRQEDNYENKEALLILYPKI